MNPWVLSLADGTTFFVGVALVVLAQGALLWLRETIVRGILVVLILAGVILVTISSTPLPGWAFGLWGILVGVNLFCNRVLRENHLSKAVAFAGLFVVSSFLAAMELPYHRTPRMEIPAGTTIYVIGDSISAGIGDNIQPWP